MGQRLSTESVEVSDDFSKDLRRSRKRSRAETPVTAAGSPNLWKRFRDLCNYYLRGKEAEDSNDVDDLPVDEEEEFEIIDPEKELQMEKDEAKEEEAKKETISDPFLQFPFLVDKKSIDFIRENKVMMILRGLSGSGKSTIVSHIVRVYPEAVVCSADEFFLDSEGEYAFDGGKIRLAHEFCQKRAKEACTREEEGVSSSSTVVVDNTNVVRWEMNFYFGLASKHGYKVILVEPKTPWRLDAQELAKRNKHGVTKEVIAKKVGQFKEVLPMYFAWFVNYEDSQKLLQLGRRWLRSCLENCAEFREDFERLSQKKDLPGMLEYFNRDACLHSNKDTVHCTAKFCGRDGDGKVYARKDAVVRSLGRVFDLSVVGFVISKDTFGARIKLSESELDLWDQDDDEESPNKLIKTDVVEPVSRKKNGKREKRTKAAVGKKAADFLKDADAESLMSSLRLEETDLSDRFRPLSDLEGSTRGRRAHITLGTSEGVKPVTTGLDALEVARAEKMGMESTSFEIGGEEEEGAVLSQYAPGWWVLYPDRKAVVQAIFTGHY